MKLVNHSTVHVLEKMEVKQIVAVACIARKMIQHGPKDVAITMLENDLKLSRPKPWARLNSFILIMGRRTQFSIEIQDVETIWTLD